MSIKEILKVCKGKLLCGDDNILIESISKDTRTIKQNELYIAIKGDKFDGNSFIDVAFENGAGAAITDNENIVINKFKNKTIILVKNSIDALCDLARYKRDNYKGIVIGITGSVGKTTTKDLVTSVLETKYSVLKTEGSSNNNIGLPLCIVNGKDADVWVIEMGMNNFGEISFLSKIVRPHYSIITNIGTSHIGILGSREDILKAKLEILDGMKDKKLIINNDNDLLHKYNINNKNITVGINNESDYNIKSIDKNSFSINNKIFNIFSNEEPLIIDATLAYAVGKILDVDDELINNAFINFKQLGNRLKEETAKRGFTIINDAFNACFDSISLAIDYLSKFKNRKIIILGDMLELGDYSEKLHKDVGKKISSSNIDILVTVGDYSKYINTNALDNKFKGISKHFESNDECLEYIKSIVLKNDVILVKASNRMNFIDLGNKIKEL